MASVNVNFRMDEQLKKNVEDICGRMGMNLTTALTIFCRKLGRHAGKFFPVHDNLPGSRDDRTGTAFDQCRLSRTIFSDQRKNLTCFQLQRNVFQRNDARVFFPYML